MDNETIGEAVLRELRKEKGLIGYTDSAYDLWLVASDRGLIRGVATLFIVDAVKLEVEQENDFGLDYRGFFLTK